MLKINNKIEFENNLWLGIVDSSEFNSSEEDRIKAVTDIASITKGRLGFKETTYKSMDLAAQYGYEHFEKRKKLYNKLLKESADKPSTPFEFIPINYPNQFKYSSEINIFGNWKYGTPYKTAWLTNLRDRINKITHTSIKYNTSNEIKDFKIIVGKIPFKVISHLVRHRAFSFIVESSRNKKYLNEVEFWYPSWWESKIILRWKNMDDQLLDILQVQIQNKMLKPEEATMELSDRRLVLFAMAAWKQDENAWDNLFAVRGDKTGTQSITKIIVDNIKTLIEK